MSDEVDSSVIDLSDDVVSCKTQEPVLGCDVFDFNDNEIGSSLVDEPITLIGDYHIKDDAYNPDEHADNSRRNIAYILVVTLALLIIMLSSVALVFPVKIDIIKRLVEYIFNPLTTLIGTIIGFYFGRART
jgi:hypothetical protein